MFCSHIHLLIHDCSKGRTLENNKKSATICERNIIFQHSICRHKKHWLRGYTYSDWEGSVDDKKSTSAYAFSLRSGVVTWTSKNQHVISLSSTKVKYWVVVKGSFEVVWLKCMLVEMKIQQNDPTLFYYDNQVILKQEKNPFFH